MNIQFKKEGVLWIAEFEATSDFNLHLEREGTGSLRVMQRTTLMARMITSGADRSTTTTRCWM